MTTKEQAPKGAKRSAAPKRPKRSGAPNEANAGLTGKQVLALWELVISGDGKTATQRRIKIDRIDMDALAHARLITIESGRRKNDPAFGSKLHVTDEGWAWVNHQGFRVSLAPTKAAVPVFEALLDKVGKYLAVHGLALDDLLRPRRAEPEREEGAPAAHERPVDAGEHAGTAAALERRIREAYLRVTGQVLSQYVRLAQIRAELPGEAAEVVDEELRQMQQRGGTVLYPIDDPQRLRPEDDAAALRVAGERRDLVCITR
jgi:hypothetical protein